MGVVVKQALHNCIFGDSTSELGYHVICSDVRSRDNKMSHVTIDHVVQSHDTQASREVCGRMRGLFDCLFAVM